jgi:hypothetical protein
MQPYSEITLSQKPFGIGYMYIYTFWLRMTETMISQNIDFPLGTFCIYMMDVILLLLSIPI